MSSSSATTLPKPPAERTFVVAVTLLSLAAIVQLIAVAVALAGQIDFEKIGRSIAGRSVPAPVASVAPAQPDAATMQRANGFMNEAQQFREKGNFAGALQAVSEADRLVPNKPGIMLQMASDYVQMGKNPEAIAVLNRIVAAPPSGDPADEAFREQARSGLTQLGAPASAGPATSASAAPAAPAADSNAMRSEVGIPIGSVMGIVKAELVDAEPGRKNLRVATKADSSQKIDPQKFVATVDFYEQDDHGQIVHNDAPQVNEWLSYPVDWASGEPEVNQVKYRMPPTDRGDLPPLQYYGYVVAIYYKGELQDQRAEPVSLLDQFAPPIHKESTSE
ncbi:MAG TPA: hypothetical protein VIM61_05490 [Chthoniobacterales bacterium]|jgi:hypothetical protein